MHSTNNLRDDYIGSGKRLKRSISKYGRENFKFEILEWFTDRESLKKRERYLVNEDILGDKLCMNMVVGGSGGGEYLKKMWENPETRCRVLRGMSEFQKKRQQDPIYREKRANKFKITWRSNQHADRRGANSSFYGKSHSLEAKTKIGIANSIKQRGESNSQYNTCWVYRGDENKKIKRNEFLYYKSNGWILGRIMQVSARGNVSQLQISLELFC